MKTNRAYIEEYSQLLQECDAVYHGIAAKLGLSDCAFRILYILQDATQHYTQRDICAMASMSKQTVNSALKKLERDGYVTLERQDGKMGKNICLTAEGVRFAAEKIVPIMEAEERACALFSNVEKEQFFTLFHLMTARLRTELTQSVKGVCDNGAE